METTLLINLESIAKQLKLPPHSVQRTAELLEEGNTVPFITRYRKDQTGGLDEQQIRAIETEFNRAQMLMERKETILKSIASRDQLTQELAEQIRGARTLRLLEDIYLPYKPKKQTLAALARTRGLEPLAGAIIAGAPETKNLQAHAAELVDSEKDLPDVAAVLEGLQHLVAEHFGNHPKLRSHLRRHLWRTSRLTSKKIEEPLDVEEATGGDEAPGGASSIPSPMVDSVKTSAMETPPEATVNASPPAEISPSAKILPSSPAPDASRTDEPTANKDKQDTSRKKEAVTRRDQRRETRRRRRERLVQAFKDYFEFSDPIGRIPHHRILAINRGERTKVLRIRLECPELDKFQAEVEQNYVAADHIHADFLRRCIQDALTRLLVPSLEREVRRELNDKAEDHAVSVFARNLRKLLLQPPLHQHRLIAIDPGFRSGCKLIALDEFGKVLGHMFIHLVGKEQQKQTGRASLVKFVQQYQATVIAIGNGTACRETETLVAEVLTHELKDQDVAYLIVNGAGASVYSTSELGREELPNYDPTVRSAVSIGRRSLDPLSELVKIDPASIGVGLYQHDVKAKHLRESLDAVVESCVNYVGVDVNSASPSLLRYVSGLNTLTARRIFEHRQQHGPFRNREQLKEVSGIGESTYVQATGFLKIVDGENPLDGTWIHPESYAIAGRVLEAIGFGVNDLRASHCTTADPPEQDMPGTSDACPETSAEVSSAGASVAVDPKQDGEASISEETDRIATAASTMTGAAAVPSSTSNQTQGATAVSSPPAELPMGPTPQPSNDNGGSMNGAVVAIAPAVVAVHEGGEACPKPTSGHATRMLELAEKLAAVDVDQLAPDLGVGKLLLRDMLAALARPGRDPREDLPPPIFRRGVLKLEDLKPGMELSGTVLNVVDFGAFVDIGLVDSGLVHVSRLADRFIADPHDVVSVGDILRVWVVEVDPKRRRVSLTAIEPGTERPKPEKRKPKSGRIGAPQSKKGHPARSKRPPQHGQGPRTTVSKPKSKPKPVVPITKKMEEGKEPMRTFGDLKQLFDKRTRGEGE